MTDPKLLAAAVRAAVEAEERRQEQQRAALGEFVGRILSEHMPDEPTRDAQGRFTGEEGKNG